MTETRLSAMSSQSSTSSASISSESTRPSKRRIVSNPDLPFFTPAATSFQPMPYTPSVRGPSTAYRYSKVNPVARTRTHDAVPVHGGMDPSPSDPDATFLHPPFDTFPGSENYPEGLNYNVMAENPEWFLVPADFITFNISNPNAIPYPSELEPPRGWCPAKKRDLVERGPEGWPEGEEPRLRCTFCRRTYAGVNAKSMWRRHVYEKHKIAMSNRRDGDRPRGRGANKENKLQKAQHPDALDSIVSIEVAPQLATNPCDNPPQKSRFRAAEEIQPSTSRNSAYNSQKELLSPSRIDFSNAQDNLHSLAQSSLSPMSPPPTPTKVVGTPSQGRSSEASSPYDPLVTPSFRHSPLRLPSDKPWRFSPGHPLYSRTREIVLTTLMPPVPSPVAGMKRPCVDDSPCAEPTKRPLELATPESLERFKATPLHSLLKSRSKAPWASKRRRLLDNASPLSKNFSTHPSLAQKRAITFPSLDDWPSDLSNPSTRSPGILKGGDLFADVWTPIKQRRLTSSGANSSPMRPEMLLCSPPLSSSGTESPVLRSSTSSHADGPSKLVGLGIGLMEAFTLPGDEEDSDFDGELMYSEEHEDDTDDAEEVENSLSCQSSASQNQLLEEVSCHPPKKRLKKEGSPS